MQLMRPGQVPTRNASVLAFCSATPFTPSTNPFRSTLGAAVFSEVERFDLGRVESVFQGEDIRERVSDQSASPPGD